MATMQWYGDTTALVYDAGTHAPIEGETLTGGTSGATGVVRGWNNAAGWGGAGTGTIWVGSVVGTFENNDELTDPDGNDVADVDGTPVDKSGDFAEDGNWGGGLSAANPANADTVYFKDSSQAVTTGWDQSAVALTALYIEKSYTGNIGDSYNYLQIGTVRLEIGQNLSAASPAGSGRIKIDLGAATTCTAIIYDAGTPTDANMPSVRLLAVDAATTIEVRKGKVAVAYETGEVSTIGELVVGSVTNKDEDADVWLGEGVTITTITQSGGELDVADSAGTLTTLDVFGGKCRYNGGAAITTANIFGDGTVELNKHGTITTLNVFDSGHADFSKTINSREITTAKVGGSGKITYDPAVLTMTNKIQPYDTGVVTIQAA